jgi:hypothetical protein
MIPGFGGFLQQRIPKSIGFNTKWSNLDALGVSLSIYYISWKIEVLKETNICKWGMVHGDVK